MRKWVVLALFLMAGRVHAVRPQFDEWRSTEITFAQTDVMVATGTIYIYKIQVTSGTSGTSTFRYFNSTGTLAGGVSRSSSVFYETGDTGDEWEVRDTLSRGFRYSTTGAVSIRVLWNWITGSNGGESTKGLK